MDSRDRGPRVSCLKGSSYVKSGIYAEQTLQIRASKTILTEFKPELDFPLNAFRVLFKRILKLILYHLLDNKNIPFSPFIVSCLCSLYLVNGSKLMKQLLRIP